MKQRRPTKKRNKRKKAERKSIISQQIAQQIAQENVADESSHANRMHQVFGNGIYSGDHFGQRGNYNEGLIYRSRMNRSHYFHPLDIAFQGQRASGTAASGQQKEQSAAVGGSDPDAKETKPNAAELKAPGQQKKANSRRMIQQTVAESLFNLSCQDNGEEMILKEGGLQALNELALSDDTRTLLYTSAAFANLTCHEPSRPPILEGKIIGALTACVEGRAWNREVREYCARALCRLSCCKETEREMVQENALTFPTITKLIGTINEGPADTWYCAETCVRAAINILHIGSTETPFLISAVMQCLKSMSATGTRAHRQFCALAIRNMSCLPISVDKIVECGAVYVISNVLSENSFDPIEFEKGHPLHGVATNRATESDNPLQESRARRHSNVAVVSIDQGPKMAPADVLTVLTHCATALCNMGCVRSVRENLLRDKIVLVLTRIVAYAIPLVKMEEYEQLLEWCALTLSTMTHQEDLRQRLINDNVIPALAVLVGLKSLAAMRAVAYALAALSWKDEGCVAVVECGCAAAILNFVDCDDIQVKQDSTLLLSNILSNENLYITMVDAGVISVLNRLAIWVFKTKAISNASAIAPAPVAATTPVASGGRLTTAMVAKQRQQEEELLKQKKQKQLEEERLALIAAAKEEISHACALSFFNVTCHDRKPEIRLRVVKEGILLGLIRLLGGDNDLNQQRAVGALRNLSNEDANQQRISSEGVVEKLVAATGAMTEQAKVDCVAIICNLARVEVLRQRVVADGACDVLVSFSQIRNEDIKLYCSMALCCLSSTVPLVQDGVYQALVNLSQSNSTVVWCALAMSQLSSQERSRKLMLRDSSVIPGLVQMMRSSDSRSQLHGSIALCNLSTNTLAKKAIYEQQEYDNLIVITILRLNQVETREVCAKILFNLLTNADTRVKMVKNLFVYAFITLAKNNSSEIQYLCVKTLYNLSCSPELGNAIVEQDAMPILIAKSSSSCSMEVCRLSAGALCNLSAHTANIPMMVKQGVVTAAVSLVTKQDVETIQRVAMLLCNLSWDESSVRLLVEQNCVPTLVSIINAKIPFCRELCATCLCNLSQTNDKEVRSRIVKDGAILALATTIVCTVEKANADTGEDGTGDGKDTPSRHNMLRPPTASSVKLEPDPGMNVDTTLDVIRTICNLCGHNNKSARSSFIHQGGVKSIVALHTHLLDGEQGEGDAESEDYEERVQHVLAGFASLVCDLSRHTRSVLRVLEERAVTLLRDAAGMAAPDTRMDCAVALCNLSFHREGHPLMVRHGAIEAIAMLCPKTQDDGDGGSDGVISDGAVVEVDELVAPYLAATLRNLTSNAAARQALVKQEQTLKTLFLLSTSVDEPTRANIAIALYNLTDTKQLRSKMVEEGVTKVFIRLSEQSSEDPAEDEVTQVCTAGLQNLIRFIKQSGQLQSMERGLVKSLLRMIDKDMDDWIFDSKKLAKPLPQPKFRGNVPTHRHVGWVPRAAELKPDWRDVTIAGVKTVPPEFPTQSSPATGTSRPRHAPMPDFILRSFGKMTIDDNKADLDMDFEATYRDPLREAEEEQAESKMFEEEDEASDADSDDDDDDDEEDDEDEDEDEEEEEDEADDSEEDLEEEGGRRAEQEELEDGEWVSEFARDGDNDQVVSSVKTKSQLPALMRPDELFEAMASSATDLQSPWSTAPDGTNDTTWGLGMQSSAPLRMEGESWYSVGMDRGAGRELSLTRSQDAAASRSAPAGLTTSALISSFESTPLMSHKVHRGGKRAGMKGKGLSTSPLSASRSLQSKQGKLLKKKQIVRGKKVLLDMQMEHLEVQQIIQRQKERKQERVAGDYLAMLNRARQRAATQPLSGASSSFF